MKNKTLTKIKQRKRWEYYETIGFGFMLGFICCEFIYWILVKKDIIEIIY